MSNEIEKEPLNVGPESVEVPDRDAEDRVKQAGNVLAMLEGDPDRVADLVADANSGYWDGRVPPEDATAADLVAELGVLEGGDPTSILPRVLHDAAPGPLGDSLKTLFVTGGDGAVERVTAAIDEVEEEAAFNYPNDVPNHEHGGLLVEATAKLEGELPDLEEADEKTSEPGPLVALQQRNEQLGEAMAMEVQAQELLNSLRDIREKNPEFLGYSKVEEALRMIGEVRLDAKNGVQLLEEIYNTYMAMAPSFVSQEADISKAESMQCGNMLEAVKKFPAKKLHAMLMLPKEDRGNLDYITKRVMDALDLPVDKKTFQARLDGYNTLTEKFAALESGEIKSNDDLNRLDLLAEVGIEADDTEKIDIPVDYLTQDLGVPLSQAVEMVVAMRGRNSVSEDIDDDLADRILIPKRLYAETQKLAEVIVGIGLDNVKKLRERCGIVNFAEMSHAQLDRMIRFANGDPELLKELQQKEVCVVIRDATQDWNGSFSGLYQDLETTDGATLIFEVSSLMKGDNQIKQYVEELLAKNVHPSVLAIVGHGSPGSVYMGAGNMRIVPTEPLLSAKPEDAVTLADTDLDQLIGNMKPDRDGNCSIIYESCSQAGDLVDKDDSTLSRTAKVARNMAPGKPFQVYGVREGRTMRHNNYGELTDVTAHEPITRVVVGKYGDILVHDSETAPPRLPMFGTNIIDLRKRVKDMSAVGYAA